MTIPQTYVAAGAPSVNYSFEEFATGLGNSTLNLIDLYGSTYGLTTQNLYGQNGYTLLAHDGTLNATYSIMINIPITIQGKVDFNMPFAFVNRSGGSKNNSRTVDISVKKNSTVLATAEYTIAATTGDNAENKVSISAALSIATTTFKRGDTFSIQVEITTDASGGGGSGNFTYFFTDPGARTSAELTGISGLNQYTQARAVIGIKADL